MKLSEAIRLGSMMKPQAFGAYETDGRTCAYGAAREAIGRTAEFEGDDPPEWERLDFTTAVCPECGDARTVFIVITRHLNDDHRWTREAIADWVETIEDAQVAKVGEAGCAEAVPTGSERKA